MLARFRFGLETNSMDYLSLIRAAKADGRESLVVGAFLINPEGRVLVVRRRADDFMGGLFELPSGNVEQGETLPGALVREVHEECGLTIAEHQILGLVNQVDYQSQSKKTTKRQFNFVVRLLEPIAPVTLSPDHDKYEWVEPVHNELFDAALNAWLSDLSAWLDSDRRKIGRVE